MGIRAEIKEKKNKMGRPLEFKTDFILITKSDKNLAFEHDHLSHCANAPKRDRQMHNLQQISVCTEILSKTII